MTQEEVVPWNEFLEHMQDVMDDLTTAAELPVIDVELLFASGQHLIAHIVEIMNYVGEEVDRRAEEGDTENVRFVEEDDMLEDDEEWVLEFTQIMEGMQA